MSREKQSEIHSKQEDAVKCALRVFGTNANRFCIEEESRTRNMWRAGNSHHPPPGSGAGGREEPGAARPAKSLRKAKRRNDRPMTRRPTSRARIAATSVPENPRQGAGAGCRFAGIGRRSAGRAGNGPCKSAMPLTRRAPAVRTSPASARSDAPRP